LSTSAPATVVLVHGAWHGAWCWDKVAALLEARGVPVVTLDLPGHGESREPLGDLASDGAALAAALGDIDGPIVVCGHSYGGAVVSEGAGGHDGVRHLVFLTAFPLDVGESCTAAAVGEVDPAETAESLLGAALRVDDDGVTTLDPVAVVAALFHDCADDDVAFALERLGPQAMDELQGQASRAAWRDVPSTYVVCTEDRGVPPSLQRALARRATEVVEWPTSHSPFLSRPELVVDLLAGLAER
jgi:pimeloyl-ACP methyl ester carboxylesterase